MSEPEMRFPEFGDGGDQIGARRARRAFRWCVLVCVLFMAALWVSEQFLRQEHTESLYLSALTKDAQSGKNILRQAVVQKEKRGEDPAPKYLWALAEREEEDQILPTYARAYELDPGNALQVIRYGCSQLRFGDPSAGRTLFHEAAEKARDNALPLYLEAATIPWVENDEDALARSLTHIARANASGRSIVFPRPLWFGELPQTGYLYAELRRQIMVECCAPLYAYTDRVIEQVRNDTDNRSLRRWDSSLTHLEEMGRRFMLSAAPSTNGSRQTAPGAIIQAHLGLYIQHAALEQRKRIAQIIYNNPGEEFVKQALQVKGAIKEITAFDEVRTARIATEQEKFALPLWLCARTLGLLGAMYILVRGLSVFLSKSKAGYSIQHTRSGYAAMTAVPAVFFLLLIIVSAMQHSEGQGVGWMGVVDKAWWTILVVYAAAGWAYPATVLRSVHDAIETYGESGDSEKLAAAARRARRAAYASLLRRYYGIATGMMLGVVSLWTIGYRVIFWLYPWQIELLASGLEHDEAQLLDAIVGLLG